MVWLKFNNNKDRKRFLFSRRSHSTKTHWKSENQEDKQLTAGENTRVQIRKGNLSWPGNKGKTAKKDPHLYKKVSYAEIFSAKKYEIGTE